MRLIDADKVLAEFPVRRNHHDEKHGNMHFINGIETVMEYLDEIADTFPIDTEPVRHGRWIDSGINGTVSCSLCKFTDFFAKQNRVMLFKYCPYCGARMDGGNKNG